MITNLLIIAAIIAYLACGFGTMVLDSHESTTESGTGWRVFCLLFWPLPVFMFVVVLLWQWMDESAHGLASRIKEWSKE